MNTATILTIVKARLGISSTTRDTYLTQIINSIIKELEDEKGIVLEADNDNHVMFIVDYSTWRYQSRDGSGDTPRHIKFRLHNLMLHNGGGTNEL